MSCLKCPNQKQEKARKYCTHYRLDPQDLCTRDFEKFPVGWGLDSVPDFEGIKGGDDSDLMFMNVAADASVYDLEDLAA